MKRLMVVALFVSVVAGAAAVVDAGVSAVVVDGGASGEPHAESVSKPMTSNARMNRPSV